MPNESLSSLEATWKSETLQPRGREEQTKSKGGRADWRVRVNRRIKDIFPFESESKWPLVYLSFSATFTSKPKPKAKPISNTYRILLFSRRFPQHPPPFLSSLPQRYVTKLTSIHTHKHNAVPTFLGLGCPQTVLKISIFFFIRIKTSHQFDNLGWSHFLELACSSMV